MFLMGLKAADKETSKGANLSFDLCPLPIGIPTVKRRDSQAGFLDSHCLLFNCTGAGSAGLLSNIGGMTLWAILLLLAG